MASVRYRARADAFARAVDIGVEVYARHPPSPEGGLPFPPADDYARESRGLAENARAPEPAFANLESLAFLEDAFLTFWNESHGPHISLFWRLVAEAGLPFLRKDVVGGILARGRIRTRIEYEHAVDAVGEAGERRAELSRLIGDFELKGERKAR